MANEIKISAGRNSVCECLAHLTHQMSIGNFWFGGIKSFFKIYFTRFYFDYYTRLLHAILICYNKWNTLGAHRLLFLLFISLKNEDNHHLGVDKTMWIWVVQVIELKEICELVEISLISFPYTKRQTFLRDLKELWFAVNNENNGCWVSRILFKKLKN